MQGLPMVTTLLLLVFGTATVHAEVATTNPLSKVIELIKGLAAKEAEDMEAENKAFKEYFEWCDEVSRNMNFEIKDAKSQKAKLEAKIAELESDIDVAESKIEELGASIAAADAELKNATVIREKEEIDFAASEKELMDIIGTLGRAITIITREMAKAPAAFAQINSKLNTKNMASIMQALGAVVDAAGFTTSDRKNLIALVQTQHEQAVDDEDLDVNAPAAAVYESHSGSIVEVLEDMKEKAEEELSELRKEEAAGQHNFEMLKQSLDDQMAADTKNLDEEKSGKAKAEEDKGAAEGELEVTTKDLETTEAALKTATDNCMQVATDHDATQAAFKEELKVLAEAVKILEESTEGAVGETYSLLQVALSSKMQSRFQLANSKVVEIVKKLAQKHHSAALAQLASRILAVVRYGAANGEDPFGKVKGLITELIAKLEAEAVEEATEKKFCDEEMKKTNAKKTELTDDIDKLSAELDAASAKSATLKEQVKDLQSELAELMKAQSEMDKTRQETHDAYVTAKADLEQGLTGVRKALTLLRDYFASDADAASLMQQPEPPKPAVFEKATGAGGSIISILEVVESDFAKSLAAEETEEAEAQELYEKMTQENKITEATKSQDVKYKTQEFTGLDKTISDLSEEKEGKSTELSAVLEYLEKLTDRCVAKPETYEERKKRRDAEIAGLKEALNILETETAFFQRKHHGHIRGVLTA